MANISSRKLKNMPITPTVISIKRTYVVKKVKYIVKTIDAIVKSKNRTIEVVCSVLFPKYPISSLYIYIKKKKNMLAISSSHIAGGYIKPPLPKNNN